MTATDNRLFVEAVLFRYRAGIPWRDLPERFGDWKNVHRRFSRWAKTGVWKQMFAHLAEDADNEYAMIDSTVVGDPDGAERRLHSLLRLANDVGLFAEEADAETGEPLGNFPQAFTTLASSTPSWPSAAHAGSAPSIGEIRRDEHGHDGARWFLR